MPDMRYNIHGTWLRTPRIVICSWIALIAGFYFPLLRLLKSFPNPISPIISKLKTSTRQLHLAACVLWPDLRNKWINLAFDPGFIGRQCYMTQQISLVGFNRRTARKYRHTFNAEATIPCLSSLAMVIKVSGHVNRAFFRVWRHLSIPGCLQALGLWAINLWDSRLAYYADFSGAYKHVNTF